MNIILYKEYLEIGKVVSTKGLKGEVVVECWCDTPEFLGRFKEIYFRFMCAHEQVYKNYDYPDNIEDAAKAFHKNELNILFLSKSKTLASNKRFPFFISNNL